MIEIKITTNTLRLYFAIISVNSCIFCAQKETATKIKCNLHSDLGLGETIVVVLDGLWNALTWWPAAYTSNKNAGSWQVFPGEKAPMYVRTWEDQMFISPKLPFLEEEMLSETHIS